MAKISIIAAFKDAATKTKAYIDDKFTSLNAGSIPFDSSETYSSGTVGNEIATDKANIETNTDSIDQLKEDISQLSENLARCFYIDDDGYICLKEGTYNG